MEIDMDINQINRDRAACREWDANATEAEYAAVEKLCEQQFGMPGPQACIEECPGDLLELIEQAKGAEPSMVGAAIDAVLAGNIDQFSAERWGC